MGGVVMRGTRSPAAAAYAAIVGLLVVACVVGALVLWWAR